MENRVCLVIRYDDYGAAYSPRCAARFDVEQMIDREIRARGWSWLCGITPRQSVDPENVQEERTVSLWEDRSRIELVRGAVSDGFCEPAVHGLTHHTWKQLPRYGTEFAGLPAERQLSILQTAKREVEELVQRSVHVLIPPWNRFDEGTIWAASHAGFSVLSGSTGTLVRESSSVRLVPATVEPQHLQRIMDRGQRFPGGSVVVLLLHATDFVTVDERIGYLREADFGPLLDRAVEQLGVEVVPMARAVEHAGAELEERAGLAFVLSRRHQAVSVIPVLGKRVQQWMFPSVSGLLPVQSGRRLARMTRVGVCLWFLVVAATASLPTVVVASVLVSEPARRRGAIILIALGAVLTAYSTKNAVLKRFYRRWDAQEVGLRTWTGIVLGSALVVSSVLWWALG